MVFLTANMENDIHVQPEGLPHSKNFIFVHVRVGDLNDKKGHTAATCYSNEVCEVSTDKEKEPHPQYHS